MIKDIWGREVHVDTCPWQNRNFTAKEPRGRGDWKFHYGGYAYGAEIQPDSIYLGATYSQALKAAARECAAMGRNLVVVL